MYKSNLLAVKEYIDNLKNEIVDEQTIAIIDKVFNDIYYPQKEHGNIKVNKLNVIEDYENGLSIDCLAKKYNCCVDTIRTKLKGVEKIKTSRKHRSKKTLNIIEELNTTDKRLSDIAKQYGVSKQYVSLLNKNLHN